MEKLNDKTMIHYCYLPTVTTFAFYYFHHRYGMRVAISNKLDSVSLKTPDRIFKIGQRYVSANFLRCAKTSSPHVKLPNSEPRSLPAVASEL